VEMKKYCEEVDIGFSSTPFSKQEADFLVDKLDVDFIKVASMDLNNYPFLRYLSKKGKPMILSTGMSTLSEIDEAVRTIEAEGNNETAILHCVSVYPPKDEDVNLKNMDTLAAMYDHPVGFSDHTIGTVIPLAAIAKGAAIVEKHFTLDKEMFGWDHKVSADADDMRIIVDGAKRINAALGSSRITRTESDERLSEYRRSIVAVSDIKCGDIITEEKLDFKRPGRGLPPEAIEYIVGKPAKRDIAGDEMVVLNDF